MSLDNTITATIPSLPSVSVELPAMEIWAGASAIPNPGLGVYAAIMRNHLGEEREIIGWKLHATNNGVELMSALIPLELMKSKPRRVFIMTNGEYTQLGMSTRMHLWKKQGWRGARTKLKNRELWERLYAAAEPHKLHCGILTADPENPMRARIIGLMAEARTMQKGDFERVIVRPVARLAKEVGEAVARVS